MIQADISESAYLGRLGQAWNRGIQSLPFVDQQPGLSWRLITISAIDPWFV